MSAKSDDDDWEDIYMVMDVKEFEGTNMLSNIDSYSIIGIDSNSPVVKLGNYVFEGVFDQYMGTGLLFEHHEDKKLSYHSKTRRVLRLKRIILKPTLSDVQQEEEQQQQQEQIMRDNEAMVISSDDEEPTGN